MTALVLDCSIAAAWLFADEADPETDHLLARIKDGARWYPTSGILKSAICCYKPKKGGELPRLRLMSRITRRRSQRGPRAAGPGQAARAFATARGRLLASLFARESLRRPQTGSWITPSLWPRPWTRLPTFRCGEVRRMPRPLYNAAHTTRHAARSRSIQKMTAERFKSGVPGFRDWRAE